MTFLRRLSELINVRVSRGHVPSVSVSVDPWSIFSPLFTLITFAGNVISDVFIFGPIGRRRRNQFRDTIRYVVRSKDKYAIDFRRRRLCPLEKFQLVLPPKPPQGGGNRTVSAELGTGWCKLRRGSLKFLRIAQRRMCLLLLSAVAEPFRQWLNALLVLTTHASCLLSYQCVGDCSDASQV